jgi:hypothetical protein
MSESKTTNIVELRTPNAKLFSLDDLFAEAAQMGRVQIYSDDAGNYCCVIKFPTVAGINVQAQSDYGQKCPHDALRIAIEKAKEIRKAFV